MHPLVRDLYKRVILVGRDYPLGLDYVRKTWKKALRNPDNCPSCYCTTTGKSAVANDNHNRNEDSLPLNNASNTSVSPQHCERELRKAVGKGRYYVRKMIGVIQLKKYRTMKKRYSNNDNQNDELQKRMQEIVREAIGGGEEK